MRRYASVFSKTCSARIDLFSSVRAGHGERLLHETICQYVTQKRVSAFHQTIRSLFGWQPQAIIDLVFQNTTVKTQKTDGNQAARVRKLDGLHEVW